MSERPDLIPTLDRHSSQQVGIDLVIRVRHRGPRPGMDRLQAHQAHQPLDPLAIDRLPLAGQDDRHPTAAVERVS